MKTIRLAQGRKAIVDDADYELLIQFRWRVRPGEQGRLHAVRTDDGAEYKMEQHLIPCSEGMVIDHIDGNTLNNQRHNLRTVGTVVRQPVAYDPVTLGQPAIIRGVTRIRGTDTWGAAIRKDGVTYDLGVHDSEVMAALAYDRKARELWGDLALLNFPR